MDSWSVKDANNLLALVASCEGNRQVTKDEVRAWTIAGQTGRWTLDLASRAVIRHVQTSSYPCRIHDVHAMVVSWKNEAVDRAAVERARADDSTKKPRPVGALLAGLADRWAVPEDDDDGAAAGELARITAPCPHCRAAAGSPCTKHGRDGEQIVAPHPSRHDALAELADGLADVDSPVRCPECHAPPGRRCVNTRTGSYISFRLGTHHKRMVAEHDDDGGRGESSNADQIRMQAHGEWKTPAGGDG